MSIVFILLLLSSPRDPEPPPGTVLINGIYIDQTEIQNIHWLEFMHFRSKELDSAEFVKLSPALKNTWFGSTADRHKPIVLITYEQALEYCAWRSEAVSKLLGRDIVYRLPTAAEWKAV